MNVLGFFIASLWLSVVAGLDSGGKFVDCPGVDYSPCRCRDMSKESFGQGILSFFGLSQSKSVFRVVCNRVLIAQVKDAFSRTTTRDLDRIVLNIAPFETSAIPADLLSDSRASEIRINCVETLNPLLIDENSFRSSRNVANKIEISGCDLKQQPNFAFLKGFQVLSNLKVENSSNFNSFQGIPSQLRSLSIENSRGFDNLADGSKISLPGLDRLSLNQNGFGDVTTAKILKTFAESSKESLTFLDLQENELTRIPELVSSFTKLNQLWLEFNAITSIDTPFSFSSLAPNIHLDDNAISSIKPNAFGEGNYHIVGLNDNKLTRLDSYVFQVLLEVISRKEKSSRSSLWLGRNPIVCDCHLAWLIVHKRNLLPRITDGMCSNSTLFKDLKPEGFRDCPVFTCPVDIDGKFLNPLSCSSHYTCTAGEFSLEECPGSRVFNPSKQICDLIENVPSCK